MELSFNLIEQPWIPCIKLDGSRVRLGIGQTLKEAHTLREVHAQSPLVTVSILRLLLAILHRAYGPSSEDEWCDMYQSRCWDLEKLERYLSKWADRFDLFHDAYPFYQVTDFPPDKLSPISRLALELASGNNDTLFDHSTEESPDSLSSADAAAYLLATQNYGLTGRSATVYASLGPLMAGMQVLARGDNLWESLTLNLVPYDGKSLPFEPQKGDRPHWEEDQFHFLNPPPVKPISGYLEYLTFNSRYVQLIPQLRSGMIVVTAVGVAQRASIPPGWLHDAFKIFIQTRKNAIVPMSLKTDRALWRDSDAVLGMRGGVRQPSNIQRLASAEAIRNMRIGARLNVEVFGVANDKSAVEMWRHERLPLPLQLLQDERCRASLGEALTRSEVNSFVLKEAVDRVNTGLLPTHGKKMKGELIIDPMEAMRSYWSALEIPFFELLDAIGADQDETLRKWDSISRTAALDAFSSAVVKLRFTARALHAIAVCEQRLRSQLFASRKELPA